MKNIFFSEDVNFFLNFGRFLETREQTNTVITDSVRKVIEDVKINKDAAVIKYTKKFDNIDLDRLGYFSNSMKLKKVEKKL